MYIEGCYNNFIHIPFIFYFHDFNLYCVLPGYLHVLYHVPYFLGSYSWIQSHSKRNHIVVQTASLLMLNVSKDGHSLSVTGPLKQKEIIHKGSL